MLLELSQVLESFQGNNSKKQYLFEISGFFMEMTLSLSDEAATIVSVFSNILYV
tara:strand:+ start:3580 stop:3741 length:162 start_codon:yes stop_codon:yes gene_type:complete